VVVGAGMAGLAAARALADYFEHVVVLERDTLPLDASHRSGTPQSRHVHELLGGGQGALGDLFPGFEHDLAAAGAVPLRVGLDVRIETPGYDPFPRRDLGWIAYSMSRPLIESIVRGRVERHPNITICQRCRARFVVPTSDGAGVAALHFENGDGKSETLPADLVVDASGRGNLTSAFLESVRLRQPEETVIGVDIGYATAVFAIPDDHPADWKGVRTVGLASQRTGGGLMLPLEGNRWMLTLGGRRGDKPSPQLAEASRSLIEKQRISFDLLSDPGNAYAVKLGLRFTLPDDLKGVYLSFGNDLAVRNGESSWTLPMPGRFVIDTG